MLQDILNKVLTFIIAADVFIVGVLFVFLVNFRINIRKRIVEREFATRLLTTIQKKESTEQVAQAMNMPAADITSFCKARGIELPEVRIARIEAAKRQKEEENRRIIEEEAAWRADQERIADEHQREKDAELKKRKERLRKFGIN
jgi:hypothetical protein